MRRRLLATLGTVGLLLATTGVVVALTYDGEATCRDMPAWPGGSYLGQMHPYHVQHYLTHTDDPCTAWALDQRYSAVRGLRELGYTVFGPGEFAWPPPPALPVYAPDALAYREASGYDAAWVTLDLLRGVHQITRTFDGWMDGEVKIDLVTPDGTHTSVQDGRVAYQGSFTVTAPVTGTYTFRVTATGPWWLSTGQPPTVVTVVDRPDLSVAMCEAFLGGG